MPYYTRRRIPLDHYGDTKARTADTLGQPALLYSTAPGSVWYCDAEADLPTAAEGAEIGDWAKCHAEGTTWKRIAGPAWSQITGGSGAPTDADYLVGTAQGWLSAEIVVGTSPGGELGGTWASPTVDATHSGSAHHAQLHATSHEPGGGDAIAVDAAAGTGSLRTLGSGGTQASAGNHSHAGAGHTILDAGVAETQRANLDFQDGFEVVDNAGANSTDVDLSYGAAGYPVDVAAAEADGTAITVARADHVHAHGSGYLANAHHNQAHSGSDHTDPAAATTVDIGDTASAGTGTNPPASDDHVHGFPAPGAGYPLDTTFAAEADGTATTPARSDHRHTITDPTTLPGVTTWASASTEGTSTDVARADHTHGVSTNSIFTISALILSPVADAYIVWRAPFACTVTAIRGYVDVGTTTVINAFKGSVAAPTNFSTADMTITSATTWISDTTLDVTAVASGDAVGVEVQTVGTATEVTIQIDFTRP